MIQQLNDEEYLGVRCYWEALLPHLMEEDSNVCFVTYDARREVGYEVALGTLEAGLDPRSMSAGIACVLTEAVFSQLPGGIGSFPGHHEGHGDGRVDPLCRRDGRQPSATNGGPSSLPARARAKWNRGERGGRRHL